MLFLEPQRDPSRRFTYDFKTPNDGILQPGIPQKITYLDAFDVGTQQSCR